MIVLGAPRLRAVGEGGSVQHERVHRTCDIPIALFHLLTPGLGRAIDPCVHVLHRSGHVFGQDRKRLRELGCLGLVEARFLVFLGLGRWRFGDPGLADTEGRIVASG